MKTSVINELKAHISDLKADRVLTDDNLDEWHEIAFHQDYYVIGYYQAEQWLKEHNISAWEAIEYVTEQMEFQFGEVALKPEQYNAEYIVNMLVYFTGLEIL